MTLIPPDCLGIVHTRRVLTEPEVWALERQWWCLWRKCWERQLLHSMALSSPSLGPQLCPSLKSRSIWSMYLQLAGLTTWNSRGLSEDEQESLSSAQRAAATALASYDDASLYPCFATGPLLHQFVEFFPSTRAHGAKNSSSHVPRICLQANCIMEQTAIQPYHCACLLTVHGAGKHGVHGWHQRGWLS